MRIYLLFAIMVMMRLVSSAQTVTKQESVSDAGQSYNTPDPEFQKDYVRPTILEFPQQLATFTNGNVYHYIANNIHYPEKAMKNGIEGKAVVRFIIRKDGRIEEPRLSHSSGNKLLDKEALRIISGMPRWKPGRQKGQPVDSYYQIPIDFKIKK